MGNIVRAYLSDSCVCGGALPPVYLAFQGIAPWLMVNLQLQKPSYQSALTRVNLLQSGGSSRSPGGILMLIERDSMCSRPP